MEAALTTRKDYSATPLYKKLGIKEGARLGLAGLEIEDFKPIIGDLPEGVEILEVAAEPLNVLVMFATSEEHLRRRFGSLTGSIAPNGGFWVAYPKRSSTIATDLTFDIVQQMGLDAGLVDNKSCAIDDDWSGIRFVLRLSDRPHAGKAGNRSS